MGTETSVNKATTVENTAKYIFSKFACALQSNLLNTIDGNHVPHNHNIYVKMLILTDLTVVDLAIGEVGGPRRALILRVVPAAKRKMSFLNMS